MPYLIYNDFEELIDVIEFDLPEDLVSYKRLNPSHIIEFTDNLEEKFILDEDEELEEESINNYYENEYGQ